MDEFDLYVYRVVTYKVIDGDTLDVTLDLGFNTFRKERIRFARINAPEMKTEAGPISKSHLSDLLANKNIFVQTIKDHKDKYGRYLAEVWTEEILDKNVIKYKNINDVMLSDNSAELYKK